MLHKQTLTAALSALFFLTTVSESHAEKTFEVGVFGGAHFFHNNNELGVTDSKSNNPAIEYGLAVGLRLGIKIINNLDVEAEFDFSPTASEELGTNIITLALRAHALYQMDLGDWSPFVLAGIGSSSSFSDDESDIANDTDLLFHGGLGVKYALPKGWGVRVDARLLLPPSDKSNGFTYEPEILFGIYKTFGLATSPEPVEEIQQVIPVAASSDTDGDGIDDNSDQCINQAEDPDGFEDEDGCPELDNDNDGIADADDRCPLQAEDMDDFEDEDGCPELDNDNDGIADTDDKCPLEPETVNAYQDQDGCKDEVPKEVKKFSGTIEGILFKNGSAKIRPVSFSKLDKAAAVFLQYPELRIEIQGHTDNTGNPAANLSLSQERAQSVVDYLVNQNIKADRLVAKGFGQEAPIADNSNSARRKENRRVEFKLIN